MFIKVLKKIEVYDFASKFSEIFVILGPFSGQSFKICPKWLFYLGPNIILEKVRKFENIRIIPWEMAADLLSVGWIPPPPASFRVKELDLTSRQIQTLGKHQSKYLPWQYHWCFFKKTKSFSIKLIDFCEENGSFISNQHI